MPKQQKKCEDLGIKLGSDDMVFWRTIIDNHKKEIEVLEKSLKLTRAVLSMAEDEYKKAEEEFNKN